MRLSTKSRSTIKTARSTTRTKLTKSEVRSKMLKRLSLPMVSQAYQLSTWWESLRETTALSKAMLKSPTIIRATRCSRRRMPQRSPSQAGIRHARCSVARLSLNLWCSKRRKKILRSSLTAWLGSHLRDTIANSVICCCTSWTKKAAAIFAMARMVKLLSTRILWCLTTVS